MFNRFAPNFLKEEEAFNEDRMKSHRSSFDSHVSVTNVLGGIGGSNKARMELVWIMARRNKFIKT